MVEVNYTENKLKQVEQTLSDGKYGHLPILSLFSITCYRKHAIRYFKKWK